MPIPFILGGLAAVSAVAGIKKGLDANDKNEKAERIVKKSQKKFKKAQEKLETERIKLNNELTSFAKFKLSVFTTQIDTLVKLVNQCKDANSVLNSENITFSKEEIKQLENSVSTSLEISSGLAQGLASGTLTAMGAYGGVGLLASASTGTAISTLSGAAATNATLAWLGGGSIALGGGGMAVGTAVLSGMVAGPLIAVAGFVMDSKAEENLTDAYDYESKTDQAIAKIHFSIAQYQSIYKYIDELTYAIDGFTQRFDKVLVDLNNVGIWEKIKRFLGLTKICKHHQFSQLMIIGKNLKMLLDISLIDKEGNKNKNFQQEFKKVRI